MTPPVKKEVSKIRNRLLAAQGQPIKMRVAAALVYHQITGNTRTSASGPEYETALADTAIALSQVADLYYLNAQGRLQRIPEDDVALGKFERAGDIYRSRSGQIYRDVMLRRADVMDAVVILRKARETIVGVQDGFPAIDPKPAGR